MLYMLLLHTNVCSVLLFPY